MRKRNLADEMRKKTEEGKLRQKKSQDDFDKREAEHRSKLRREALEEAKSILAVCIKEIKKSAHDGKHKLTFTAKKFTNPHDDEKYLGWSMASHLSELLKKEGFIAGAILSKSEGDVDDSRDFYYYCVEICWGE